MFSNFQTQIPIMQKHISKSDCESFAIDEFQRFHSIAGTVVASFKNVKTSLDERRITHILMRSLLESYFWLLYIFYENNPSSWDSRFDEYMGKFKQEYLKMYNEPMLPNKNKIEPPDASWSGIKKPKDTRSILAQLHNDMGDKLDYLYFLYRVSSFDTHGISLQSLFRAAFRKDCDFPFIEIEKAVDLIANQYLVIWQKIK